jgi:predicted transcriptional regulator
MAKRTQFTVDITPTTKRQLQKIADVRQVKLAVIIRWAISSYIDAQSKEQVA